MRRHQVERRQWRNHQPLEASASTLTQCAVFPHLRFTPLRGQPVVHVPLVCIGFDLHHRETAQSTHNPLHSLLNLPAIDNRKLRIRESFQKRGKKVLRMLRKDAWESERIGRGISPSVQQGKARSTVPCKRCRKVPLLSEQR